MLRVLTSFLTNDKIKPQAGKYGSAAGGVDTSDVIVVSSGETAVGAYAGTTTTTITVRRYSFVKAEYETAFTIVLPNAPEDKATASISYDTDGTLLLALSSFGTTPRTRIYRVTITGSTASAALLHTLGFAVTSFSVLSRMQVTEVANNVPAAFVVLTKPDDAGLYIMTLATGVVEYCGLQLLAKTVVDTVYYDDSLYYITAEGELFALDLVRQESRRVFDRTFDTPQGLCVRGQRLYINTKNYLYESQNVGAFRSPNTFFVRAKIQPRIVFGERPDITFRSDAGYTGVLPAPTYFESLTFEMKDLPAGMVFDPETRELKTTKNIQPGVYQVTYKATAPSSALLNSPDVPGCSAEQRFSITVGAPEAEGGLCIPGETPACTFARNTGVHICSLINTGRQTVTPIGQLPAGITLRQPQASSTVRRATPILNETGLQAQGFELTQALAVNELQLHLISYSDVVDVNTFVPTLQYRLFGCENEPPVSRLYYKREVATGPLARGHNPCGPGFAGNQVNNPTGPVGVFCSWLILILKRKLLGYSNTTLPQKRLQNFLVIRHSIHSNSLLHT